MGGGSWKAETYTSYATKKGLIDHKGMVTNKTANEIFEASQLNQALNPKGVKLRESRDSVEHPTTNAIIFALDVTGSMNFVSKQIAQIGLPKMMKEIYARQPVMDPQVMFMGFDDIAVGGHFQVSQFESDIRIAEQLGLIWLEGNGGGNDCESYSLPWFFASDHTSTDCWEKRKTKGYLFTCGDELPDAHLNREQLQRVLGYKPQGNLDAKSLLAKAQKKYNVFHIVAEEGSFARSFKNETRDRWEDLMGDNVLFLPDHTKLAEVVVSTIQIAEGAEAADVAKSWQDKKVADIVHTVTKKVKRVLEL